MFPFRAATPPPHLADDFPRSMPTSDGFSGFVRSWFASDRTFLALFGSYFKILLAKHGMLHNLKCGRLLWNLFFIIKALFFVGVMIF